MTFSEVFGRVALIVALLVGVNHVLTRPATPQSMQEKSFKGLYQASQKESKKLCNSLRKERNLCLNGKHNNRSMTNSGMTFLNK